MRRDRESPGGDIEFLPRINYCQLDGKTPQIIAQPPPRQQLASLPHHDDEDAIKIGEGQELGLLSGTECSNSDNDLLSG
jgi:hypothetical protein